MSQGMVFVLMIIVITTIGGILKARYGHQRNRDGRGLRDESSGGSRRTLLSDADENSETRQLREEVRALQERLHVLERITVEKEGTLNREIDRLRDR